MAANNNETTNVRIMESRLTRWGIADNRASLLVRELVKLYQDAPVGEDLSSAQILKMVEAAKEIERCTRKGFDMAYTAALK